MKIQPDRIDQTLELIAQGQLEPLQAARSLLGLPPEPPAQPTEQQVRHPQPQPQHVRHDESQRVQRQTLDQLVRSLGMPPPEIEQDWRQQIQSLAHAWQQTHGVPLPPLQLSDLWVDTDNRLALSIDAPAATPQSSHESLADELSVATADASTPAPDPFGLEQTSRLVSQESSHKSASLRRFSQRRVALAAAAVAACAAAAVLGSTSFRTAPESLDGQAHRGAGRPAAETRGAPMSATASPSPNSSQSPAALAGTPAEPLQTLMPRPTAPADAAVPVALPGPDDPLLSEVLSGLAGEIDSSVAADSVRQPAPDPLVVERVADHQESGSGGEAGETRPLEVSQQRPTRSAASDAVTLPPLPAMGQQPEQVLVFHLPVSDVRCEFPQPTTLVLRPLTPGRWNLVDTAGETVIASFHGSDQGLEFGWSEQAATLPVARQLPAGRLRLAGPALASPQILWLRPHLKAEPIRFQFSEPQVSASWPLGGPATFVAGELAVDVDVPESVQMSWIEPLDPHNLRRGAGLLQWAPADSEAPLIRCRLELRVAANLSLKLRYAAQLDPSLPWQNFSPEQLEIGVDRVTVALHRLLAQQSELARQYTAASTAGRRALKPTKDALEQNVRRVQTLLQRMQQLTALQTAVATEAQLRINLTTQWPDQRQTILDMTGDRPLSDDSP